MLDATSGRLITTIPAGPGPQHVVFGLYTHAPAFITSSHGSRLEAVDVATRKILRRVSVPYGSFNLATSGGLVVTSSLLDGTLTELTSGLRPMMKVTVAPRTRDVAISVW